MQDLNVLHFPLYGIRLIEASAGTGKTHSLIIIYLRLLLNLRNQSNFLKPLTTKNILVVTFTKFAVQNLKKRIEENIRKFKLDLIQGHSDNHIFSKLFLQIKNIQKAIFLLSIAEKEINQASIFTIHSFCQKILTEYTIELNMSFDVTITEDKSKLYYQICSDFWRRHFYILPLNIANFIQQFWKNPKELLKDIFPYIYKDFPQNQYSENVIHQSNKNIPTYYIQIITVINDIKQKWYKNKNDIINFLIKIPNLNHRIYNKKNLNKWVKIITLWSEQPTLDHKIPNDLNRFKSSLLKINNHSEKQLCIYNIFYSIEQLYKQLFSFRLFIFNMIKNEIQYYSDTTKHIRPQITFDDLIKLLLQNGIKNKKNKLIQKILKCYPAAIIDEFQDTDLNQYEIFYKLYSYSSKNSLTLIGDPKQAIYGFRGADIHTYIKIRQSLHYKYNLNINWRSSPGMIHAINQLFNIPDPFVFKEIDFVPVLSAHRNNMYKFMIHNKLQKPICFWLYPDNHITINNYKTIMAKECSITLKKLLYNIHNKEAWLETNIYKKKILQTSDITILVRNHAEASLIQSELLKQNISSTFLSNRKNIFETIESYELLLLLKAILFPNQNTICTALATIFFGLHAINIENTYNNKEKWKKMVDNFSEYYLIWKKNNILSMIQKIIFYNKIPEKLLSIQSGKNSLINILHLGELLNNISQQFSTEYELIQWLETQIFQSEQQHQLSDDYKIRFNNDYDHIKISTIHKSKGLEFPITFLPFLASFSNKNNFFYEKKFNLNKERLSEDLRLLYVAITRSIYHCSIGIAPIIYKHYKKLPNITDLHYSALGYLIQNKTPNTPKSLKIYLQKLKIQTNGNIDFRILSKNIQNFFTIKKSISDPQQNLSTKQWKPPSWVKNNTWKIISYSELKKINSITTSNSKYQELINTNLNNNIQEKANLFNDTTTHSFPKGKIYGLFFHDFFKTLNFKKPINTQLLEIYMNKYNIDLNLKTFIKKWIYTIINTSLNNDHLTLSKINPNNKQTEFKFNLFISNDLKSKQLNDLCKYYDSLSIRSSSLVFPKIRGILKGFIDLIFYWNHKYYLLDYKTNWLGENSSFYTKKIIEENIIKHHYTLQYQLYTVALNKFLKNKILSYNYEKDFGGIYYLFIRGIDGISINNGIYFHRPSWKFIKNLDELISKK